MSLPKWKGQMLTFVKLVLQVFSQAYLVSPISKSPIWDFYLDKIKEKGVGKNSSLRHCQDEEFKLLGICLYPYYNPLFCRSFIIKTVQSSLVLCWNQSYQISASVSPKWPSNITVLLAALDLMTVTYSNFILFYHVSIIYAKECHFHLHPLPICLLQCEYIGLFLELNSKIINFKKH